MELGKVYFWTSSIKDWQKLLQNDVFKEIVITQLQWLVNQQKIKIYGYVIMPNHVHFLWQLVAMNGKETPYASFSKWTASQFLKQIRNHHPKVLPFFEVNENERNHRFWQRDALAVEMDSRKKFEQKLDYIHDNPLQEHWDLADSPSKYKWSSAQFYEQETDKFQILTHYREYFG